ncbi:HAD family hydrolase [Rubritalea spongiae]|uniref:HAD family hydrolase n=1 Tax=Rubritalea spongiae TaxID=430797 RepID=A0ABW5E3N4_9BACT
MKNLTLALAATIGFLHADPLPSWNKSDSKQSIISFVDKVTDAGSPDYVAPAHRIATFDNDGTLWSEQPMYFQAYYIFDRIKQLAPEHPEWKEKEPFASVLKGDLNSALAGGEKALLEMAMATHANITEDEFSKSVADWLATTKHPKTGIAYTDMVFQPMLELINYLRLNDFKVFIVSGGGIDFVRVFSESAYGIPPERVIGSSIKAKFEIRDGKPVVIKTPEIDLIDDKVGKPVGIHRYIGSRPIFAAGNSDGDYQMLQYTSAGEGPRFGLIVHHTDADREFAYDRDSHVGQLNKALDDSKTQNWTIVDMKKDWKIIYPEYIESTPSQ